MSDLAKALASQIANIETKTGKNLAELSAAIAKSGISKLGQIRSWLIETHSLGSGGANTLIRAASARVCLRWQYIENGL
jgi:hypothetical protein